jgi:hypothetical protein
LKTGEKMMACAGAFAKTGYRGRTSNWRVCICTTLPGQGNDVRKGNDEPLWAMHRSCQPKRDHHAPLLAAGAFLHGRQPLYHKTPASMTAMTSAMACEGDSNHQAYNIQNKNLG